MHSWRVDLLPHLDEHSLWIQSLWNQYDYSVPWDGPRNSKLLLASFCPGIYSCLSDPDRASPTTNYVAVTGPGTAWPDGGGVRLEDIRDGASNTIIAVEVINSGIHWMEPRDLTLSDLAQGSRSDSRPRFSSAHAEPLALFADGSVRPIARDVPPEVLVGMATIDGGEPIDAEELEATRREKAASRRQAAERATLCSFVLMLVFGSILAFRPLRKWPHEGAGDSIENHEGHRGHEEGSG